MSILQSNESELRYMKRKNLNEEARVIGNYYRDIIRSYGVDCKYQKLDTRCFENYTDVIDQNVILQKAYGMTLTPDYSCSAHMITFPEVEQDIFQLQKYGLNPNADVTFYFDSTDFACALAEKCGQFKEYKIDETEVMCEVPACNGSFYYDEHSGEIHYLSSDIFPYPVGLGAAEFYQCEVLHGKLSVTLNGYEYDKETTVVCDAYDQTQLHDQFPANDDLSHSMMHKLESSKYLRTLLFLTFTVSEVIVGKTSSGQDIKKSILQGRLHGSVLFYDLTKLGKYITLIHPEVGDLITLDFPDEANPEKYEITDCFDKQLTQDGISPLLHNYVWKCKARRYVNNYDEVEENEADKRMQEKKDYQQVVDEQVASKINVYENDEDEAYGGYEGKKDTYDKDVQDPSQPQQFDFLDDGTAIDIMRFGCGSRLVTTGYDLLFIQIDGQAVKLTADEIVVKEAIFESGMKWLKATDDCVVFVNIEGKAFKIAENRLATQDQLQVCLDSLLEITINREGKSLNSNGDNFYKFNGTKTVIWATETELFCKLASGGALYQLA